MRRSDEDGGEPGTAAEERVAVRGHGTGIAEAGVRADEADEPPRRRRDVGRLQVLLNL